MPSGVHHLRHEFLLIGRHSHEEGEWKETPTAAKIIMGESRRAAGSGSRCYVVGLACLIGVLNLVYLFSPRRTANGAQGQRPELLDPTSAMLGMLNTDGAGGQAGYESAAHQAGGGGEGAQAKEGVKNKAARKSGGFRPGARKSKHKNVLFIMTDDLRPSLSIYDKPVITPAFERLADMGVVFERAYNQDPICNPSRNSMLTGRRPDTTRVWLFEHTAPHEYSNIFKYFKDEGNYLVYGAGKLWHWTSTWLEDFHNEYWPPTTDEWNRLSDENYPMMNASVQPDATWPEERFFDYRIASEGIRLLERAASEKRPFFLGIGFHQPHRPWHMPKKYWDLYDDVYVPVTPNPRWPDGAPTVASGDINPIEIGLLPNSEKRYWASPDGGVGIDALQENTRGYHASISYLDHQLERLLDSLESLGLVDDTIIVFCVDHGMNIGDHGMWDKRTLFETNARVPLIIRDPDHPQGFGKSAPALVENVDIFPTLIEMAGLPNPKDRLFPPLEGRSLVPILQDPEKAWVKDFAVTQIARCCSNGCGKEDVDKVIWHRWEVCRGGNWEWNQLNDRTYMGYSLRTDQWRYTMWVPWDSAHFKPLWDQPLAAEELYDHRDPRCNEKGNFDLCETRNVVREESLRGVRDELYAKLRSLADTYNLNAWEAWRKDKTQVPVLDGQSNGQGAEEPAREV